MKILKIILILILLFSLSLSGNAYTLTQVKLGDIQYTGTSVEVKPTTNVARGTFFYETDTLRQYVYDGSDWNLYKESKDIQYIGESGDTKPSTDVPFGALFFETDTFRKYIYDGSDWKIYEGADTFDITEYPVDGQGTSDGIQYSTPISTEAAGDDKAILSYESYTNYPSYVGNLIRVHYTINFEVKAANATADITWQLQAKDKDETTWIDMSAATTDADIGTSYVAKAIKGYMDIQADADEIPFEMQLLLQSNESDAPVHTGWSWASEEVLATNNVYSFAVFDGKLYAGTGSSVGYVYNWAGAGWTQETLATTSSVFGLAVYDGTLYAATNGKVFAESSGTWTADSNSPGDNRSMLVMDTGDGEKLYVGIEDNGCYSFDGSSWVNTTLNAGSGGKVASLANLGGVLYAGAENGSVWEYDGSGSWSETGDLTDATVVYSLAVLDDVLYAGTEPSGKVFAYDAILDSWTATGTLAGATSTRALYVHDDILYAGTGNSAAAYAYNLAENTWSTASVTSEIYILGFITYEDDLYCGSYNAATVWKATITQESGEGTGRIKNDSVINIVGRFY